MPIKITMSEDLAFFQSLGKLTDNKDGADKFISRFKALKNKGVTFQFSTYNKVTINPPTGHNLSPLELTIPVSIEGIKAGNVPMPMALIARGHIEQGMLDLETQLAGVEPDFVDLPAPEQVIKPKGKSASLKDVIASSDKPVQMNLPPDGSGYVPAKSKTKPTSANKPLPVSDQSTNPDPLKRVRLVDATEINQPVFGKDETSMYRVVGLGSVNVAIRINNDAHQLSVRAEGKFTPQATESLSALGLTGKSMSTGQTKSGYMSAHYDTSEVPAERILGAILYAKGLNLTQRVDSVEDVASGS